MEIAERQADAARMRAERDGRARPSEMHTKRMRSGCEPDGEGPGCEDALYISGTRETLSGCWRCSNGRGDKISEEEGERPRCAVAKGTR